jgi:hypothetical protein
MSFKPTLIAAAVLPLLAAPAAAQTLSLITTPAPSFSNSAASALAKVISDNSPFRATVQAQATTGFDEVNDGIADFGFSNAFDLMFVTSGTETYEGEDPRANLRAIAAITPYRVAMHVQKDVEVQSIADLAGKRISSDFNAQDTIARIIAAHLANAGLSYDDVQKVPTPNIVRSAEDFTAGRTDALFFALGSGALKQAAATVGGLRVLPIDDSDEAIARMQEVLPYSYPIVVNPSPAVDGISEPTSLIAFDMVMNTNRDTPEDTVYEVLKAIHDHKAELAETFAPLNFFNPDFMAKEIGVEYHPGAIKFYQEIGQWPPKPVVN